jgi:hypothetical protein
MRGFLGSVGFTGLLLASGQALAACECPKATLDDRIGSSAFIFSGRPVVSAPIPPGGSPFHSEQTLEAPRAAPNDLVTLFRIDTVWKGEARKTVRVRHEQGECGTEFKTDVPAIIFATSDGNGVLWTWFCSGDAVDGDAVFQGLKETLTNRLHYN